MADKDVAARRRARKARKRSERRREDATVSRTDEAAAGGKDTPIGKAATSPITLTDSIVGKARPKPKPEKAPKPKPKPKPKLRLPRRKATGERKAPVRVSVRRGAIVAGLCGCLVAGALLGYVNAPDVRQSSLGVTEVASSDTSRVIATYTWQGKTHDVTIGDYAKWAGLASSSGAYQVPAASNVTAYVQAQVMDQVAKDEGIDVSNDDIDAYAKDTLGATDIDTLASNYSMSVDDLRDLLRQTVRQSKLREKVAGKVDVTVPSAEPTAPEDGKDDATSKDYADYIVKAVGDAWDKDANGGKGGWKDSGSAIAKAMADYDVTNDSASYKAAEACYKELSSEYTTKSSAISADWASYQNKTLKDVEIDLRSAVVSAS